jgi:UDP-glucuronate 4-epimerase
MRAVVTGVAGFVGSHLAEALLQDGAQVTGIDCFTSYYQRSAKLENLQHLIGHPDFRFIHGDLLELDLTSTLAHTDVVFHQAGQPGVRQSWSSEFDVYVRQNVLVTQRLLEACRRGGVGRIVYASSSSVYGNAETYPTTEDAVPQPFSPYGVTKLAAEHLCSLYAANWGVPAVSLRYFTVYGPRQRPDMAFHRMIECALEHRTFDVYGTGAQIRDFTFVGDVVAANMAAGVADVEPGSVLNISGGSSVSLADVIATVGELAGTPVPVRHLPAQPGDVTRTGGSAERAAVHLDWKPAIGLHAGLEQQVLWHRRRRARTAAPARLHAGHVAVQL